MARIALGAKVRSKKPPIPPAPFHVVETCTSDALPRGVTVVVVTRLEPVSDSVRTRPIRTEQREDRARTDIQIDAIEHDLVAICLPQP